MTLIFPNKNHFLFNIKNTNTLLKLFYGDWFNGFVDDQIEEKIESYQVKLPSNHSFLATLQIENLILFGDDFAGGAISQKRRGREVLSVSRRTRLQQNAICSAKLKAPLLQSILVLPPIFIDPLISKALISSNKSGYKSAYKSKICTCPCLQQSKINLLTNRRFVRKLVLVKKFTSKAKLCKNQNKTIINSLWIKKPILLSQKCKETDELTFNKSESCKEGEDLKKKVPVFLYEKQKKPSAKNSEQKIQKGIDSIVAFFISNNINLLKEKFYSIKQFAPKLRLRGFAVGSSFLLIGITSIFQRQEQNRWFFAFSRNALPGFYLTSEESSWECFENITFKHLSRKYLSQCNSKTESLVKKIDSYKDIWFLGFSESWNQQAIQNYTAVFSKYCNPVLSEGSLFYNTEETGQVKKQILFAKPLQVQIEDLLAKQKQLSLKNKWFVQPWYQLYARVPPRKEITKGVNNCSHSVKRFVLATKVKQSPNRNNIFKLKIDNYKERVFIENDSVPSKMSSSATSSYKSDTFSSHITFVERAPMTYPFIKKKVSDGAGVRNILLREKVFCEEKADILSLNEIKLYNSIGKSKPKNYIDSPNDIIKNLFYKSDNFCVQPKAFSPTSKNIAFLPDQSVSFKDILERSPKATLSQDIFLLKKEKSNWPSRERTNASLSKDDFEKAIFRDRFSFLQKESFLKLPPPTFKDSFSSKVAPFFCKVSLESSLATSKDNFIPVVQNENLFGVAFASVPYEEKKLEALRPNALRSTNGYTHSKASRLKMGEKISSYFLFKRKTISNRFMSGYKKPETKSLKIKEDKKRSICNNNTGFAFVTVPFWKAFFSQKPNPSFWFIKSRSFEPWIEFSIKVPPALPFYESKIKALSYIFDPVFKQVLAEPVDIQQNQKVEKKKEKDVSKMKSVAALKKMPYKEISLNEKGEVEPLFEQVNKTFYFSPYRFVFKKSLFANYNDYLSWPKDNPIAISINPFIDRSVDEEEREIKEQEIRLSSELQKKQSKKKEKERFEKPVGSENRLLTFDEDAEQSYSQLKTGVESSSYNSPVGTKDNLPLESSNLGEEEEKKREITKSEWLEQIRESEQSLEKRKDLQKLAYPKKKALANSYLQRSPGKIQNLLVSDRKASFFGITNLFPKRLISEDQKQIASLVLGDEINSSLLGILSTQKHDARRGRWQEKIFGVKLEEQLQDQLQKEAKDQKNQSASKISYKSSYLATLQIGDLSDFAYKSPICKQSKSSICTCKPLSFKKTTAKFITRQHPIYTPNKRLRLRVPQPSLALQNSNNQARLDDLNLSGSHRWWQKRRISSSLLGAPSKRYLVMPTITTQDWRKIIEWQLKIYFLEEEKRLLRVQQGALETGVLSRPNFSFSSPGLSHDTRLRINSGLAEGDTKQVEIKNLIPSGDEDLYNRNESGENVISSRASFAEQNPDTKTSPLGTKTKEEVSLEKKALQEEAFSRSNEQSFLTQAPETKQLFTIKKLAIYLPWTSLKKSLKKPFEWPLTLLSYSSSLHPQKLAFSGDNNKTLDSKIQFYHIQNANYGSRKAPLCISHKSPIFTQSSLKLDKNPMQNFIRNKKPDSCFVSSISPPFKTVAFKVRKNQIESKKTLKLRRSTEDLASENISKPFLFEAQTQNSYLLLHTLFLAIAIKKLFKGLYKIFGTLILSKVKNSSLSVLLLPFFLNAFGSSNSVYSFDSLKTRAKHLAGSEDTISSLSEIVWYLRNSCRGRLIPRGVVLVEKASSESTHFLKAIGGEAQVPVIVQSLRALPYTQNHPQRQLEKVLTFAQKRAPCILFLDDLDSIGQSRTLLLKNNLDKPFSTATKKIEPSFLGSFNRCNVSLKAVYSSNSFLDKSNFTKDSSNSRLPIENLYARVSTYSDKSSYKSKICRPKNDRATTTLESFSEQEKEQISPFVGHLETEKIVEQRRVDLMLRLLTVMDGISGLNGVLIVTTSKNPSRLDPALLRPGRFEKLIHLKLPTKKKRISLLKRECTRLGHTNLMPWEYFGRQTQDMTGTDIASAVNHSAFRAIIQSTVHSFPTLEYGINRVAKSCKTSGCKTIDTEHKQTTSREISSQISFYNAAKKILRALILNRSGFSFYKACSKMQKIRKGKDSVSRYYKGLQKNYLIRTDYAKEGICLYAGQAALALYFNSISGFNNKGFEKLNPFTKDDGFWFSKLGSKEPWFTNMFLCPKKRLLALQSTFSFNEALNASSIIKEMTTYFCFYPQTKKNVFKTIVNQKFVSRFTNENFISSDRSFLHNKNSAEPSAILDSNFFYYNMVLTCFYVAFQNCTENRELLDFVTDHLIRFKVLKVHEILRIILFYY